MEIIHKKNTIFLLLLLTGISLHHYAFQDDMKVMKVVVGDNQLPLHDVIINQDYTTQEKYNFIQSLLHAEQIDINAQDSDGRTALNLITFYKGDPALVKLLIEYKADVNKPDRFNVTPLHNAIAFEEIDIAKLLLQAGADESLKNDQQLTPRDLARSLKTQSLFIQEQ